MTVRGMWRLWALTVVAVVLAGLTLQSPPSDETPLVAATRKEARLPTLPPPPVPVDPGPALAKLSQSTLWGPLAPRPASGASAPPPPKWSLTGFFETAGRRYVIVSFEQQQLPAQQLKQGDRLPDGSRIERIEPNRVRARQAASGGSAGRPATVWLPVTPGWPTSSAQHKR